MPELPAQAPDEAQKKANPTEHKSVGTFQTAGKFANMKVDVVTKTTPNAQGGYDTRVEMGAPRPPKEGE